MISVEEALENILNSIAPLDSEEKTILECLGQILAEDIIAGMDIPPYNNSAMDGYAVMASDTVGASRENPVFLQIKGELVAGHFSSLTLTPGTAIRIMTGAPLPEGADAVVQFEDTDEILKQNTGKEKLNKIGIFKPATPGLNIRLRGEDIKYGQSVLKHGMCLNPARIGLLASLGKSVVKVIRRPVVAILATGDELCEITQPLEPGKIYNSNSYTIAASVINCGAIPKILGISSDSIDSLNDKLDQAINSDLLITSGGVSVGDYDMVKNVLANRGNISFWTVRMKPGKPLAFGFINDKRSDSGRTLPHFGLPGNPVSSMITFEIFVRPAILKMMGFTDFSRPFIKARIDRDIINRDGRRIFSRVVLSRSGNGWLASLTGPQGSGILTSMALSHGLAIVPEDCPIAKAGSELNVMLLENRIDI